MKNFYIFQIDSEYLVLEVLQYKDRYFPKEIQRYKSLDLAEKCVRMLYEDAANAGAMTSGPSLSGAVPKSSGDGPGVEGYPYVMTFGKKRDPREKVPKYLFKRNKPKR